MAAFQIKQLYPATQKISKLWCEHINKWLIIVSFLSDFHIIAFRPTNYITMVTVSLRPIEAKDKEEWINLWTGKGGYIEFYKSLDKITPQITDVTFDRFLDPKEPVYAVVAVDDETGKLVGFAHYLTHRNTWTIHDSLYLNDLFVTSDVRLGGIGRKLIEYVYGEADKFKCEKTYWSTQFENHRAQLLYTKVGVKSGFLLYRRP